LSVPTLLIKFSIIIQWGGTIIFYNLLSKKYGYFDYVFIDDIYAINIMTVEQKHRIIKIEQNLIKRLELFALLMMKRL
jgi:hypothetical protein